MRKAEEEAGERRQKMGWEYEHEKRRVKAID